MFSSTFAGIQTSSALLRAGSQELLLEMQMVMNLWTLLAGGYWVLKWVENLVLRCIQCPRGIEWMGETND